MPQVTKSVRFYEPIKIDQNDNEKTIDPGFWKKLRGHLSEQSLDARTTSYRGSKYVGIAKTSKDPAANYLNVGRLRPRADWPGTIDMSSGEEAPLELVDRLLMEKGYLLPFGTKNLVAVMAPVAGILSVGAMERWLTHACGLTTSGDRIELRPQVDPHVLRKLNERAIGVSKLSVRVPAGSELDAPMQQGDGGQVGRAMSSATQDTTDELSLEMTWSFGHHAKEETWREKLLGTAQWIAKSNGPDKIEVGMLLPEGDSFRIETHNLFKDNVTSTAKFTVPDDEQPSETSVLHAMNGAIKEFRRRAA